MESLNLVVYSHRPNNNRIPICAKCWPDRRWWLQKASILRPILQAILSSILQVFFFHSHLILFLLKATFHRMIIIQHTATNPIHSEQPSSIDHHQKLSFQIYLFSVLLRCDSLRFPNRPAVFASTSEWPVRSHAVELIEKKHTKSDHSRAPRFAAKHGKVSN